MNCVDTWAAVLRLGLLLALAVDLLNARLSLPRRQITSIRPAGLFPHEAPSPGS